MAKYQFQESKTVLAIMYGLYQLTNYIKVI